MWYTRTGRVLFLLPEMDWYGPRTAAGLRLVRIFPSTDVPVPVP